MQDAETIVITVLNDCKRYLGSFYHGAIITGAVLAFFYCLSLFITVCDRGAAKNDILRSCIKIPFVAVLGFYFYLVLGVTILSREAGTVYILHLIPFSTWGSEQGYLALWAENILMTMPLGILLYILWMPFRKAGWSLLAGGLFSLMIESIQLFTRLGKFETDDIMNNVFGTLVGFLVCKFISVFKSGLRKAVCKAGECKGEKTQEHLL